VGDDDPRVRRRVRELRVADRRQRQVAERAAPLPALEARLVVNALGPSVRIDSLERLQPRDPCQPVAFLAAALCVEEVLGERARVPIGEPERAQPLERVVVQERTGSDLTIVPRSSATSCSAIPRSSCATGDSGAATISGSPASPHSRSSGSRGT
jgi:hypothetical protein